MGAGLRLAREVVTGLVDLVLPTDCGGCGEAGVAVCGACRAALDSPARRSWPDPAPLGLPEPWAVASYAGPVRRLVVAHKESGRVVLARPLGVALGRSVWSAAGAPVDHPLLLVPAPSRRAAVRRRGTDATLAMARHAAVWLRRRGCEARVLPVLRVRSGVRDQSALTAAERAANVSGAMRVPRRLGPIVAGRRVVVVDDVVTTGATLAEAARAVESAGAVVLAAAVVAATSRRARGGE